MCVNLCWPMLWCLKDIRMIMAMYISSMIRIKNCEIDLQSHTKILHGGWLNGRPCKMTELSKLVVGCQLFM